MASENDRLRISLFSGDESADEIRSKMSGKDLHEVEIVLRGPDGIDEEELAATARLCSCRRVCIALIEPR